MMWVLGGMARGYGLQCHGRWVTTGLARPAMIRASAPCSQHRNVCTPSRAGCSIKICRSNPFSSRVIRWFDMSERGTYHSYGFKLALCLFVLVATLGLRPDGALAAPADASLTDLVKRLRSSDDFRVRTQAALALGASGDGRAVKPLCTALSDANAAVRTASAAALSRTGRSGVSCVRRRLKVETVPHVQAALRDTLRLLTPAPPALTEDTKYYVAIGEVTNGTTRPDNDLQRVVRTGFVKYFSKLAGFVVAPEGETPEQAAALLKKHPRVKPLYVWPKVSIRYQNGDLVLELNLSLFTYPGKAFRGSVTRSLTMQDVEGQDSGAEDELIDMASGALVPDVEREAPRI